MGTDEPTARGYTRIELFVRRGIEPIEGTWRNAEFGETVSFWGWLELISALEKIRATARDCEPERRSTASGLATAVRQLTTSTGAPRGASPRRATTPDTNLAAGPQDNLLFCCCTARPRVLTGAADADRAVTGCDRTVTGRRDAAGHTVRRVKGPMP